MTVHEIERCPHPSGYVRNLETGELVPLPCNRWTCPVCGPRRKAALLDDIAYGGGIIQANGRRWRFLTLTLSTKVNGRDIDLFWARFRAHIHNWRVKQGHKIPVQYFKVKEFTEKGQRHLHVLIDTFVPFNFIQHAWRQATEGTSFWVHIKKAQVKSAAGYMSKYMTKQTVMSDKFDKGERRYSFSHRFPRIPRPEKPPGPSKWAYLSAVDYMYALIDAGLWYEDDTMTPEQLRQAAQELAKRVGVAKPYEPKKKPVQARLMSFNGEVNHA